MAIWNRTYYSNVNKPSVLSWGGEGEGEGGRGGWWVLFGFHNSCDRRNVGLEQTRCLGGVSSSHFRMTGDWGRSRFKKLSNSIGIKD